MCLQYGCMYRCAWRLFLHRPPSIDLFHWTTSKKKNLTQFYFSNLSPFLNSLSGGTALTSMADYTCILFPLSSSDVIITDKRRRIAENKEKWNITLYPYMDINTNSVMGQYKVYFFCIKIKSVFSALLSLYCLSFTVHFTVHYLLFETTDSFM